MKRDPNVTKKIMSCIKSTGTKPERTLAKAMWQKGLRYRKHYNVVGKPDFVFIRKKIAIFCDGDFWHGNNWKLRGLSSRDEELGKYSEYWKKKILRNVQRDEYVTENLESEGWLVLRFWESAIKDDVNECVKSIESALRSR